MLILRSYIAVIFISVIVIFAGDKPVEFGKQDVAVDHLVGALENIVIKDYAVNIYSSLAGRKSIPRRLIKSFPALNSTYPNVICGAGRKEPMVLQWNLVLFPEVWVSSLGQRLHNDGCTHLFSWGSARIGEFDRNYKGLIERWFSVNVGNSYPCPLIEMGVVTRKNDAITSGTGGFLKFWILPNDFSELTTHHLELTAVDVQSAYSNDNKSAINEQVAELKPSKFSSYFWGICWMIAGSVLALCSQIALFCSGGRDFKLRKRMLFGVVGWFVVIGTIWHGLDLLLG